MAKEEIRVRSSGSFKLKNDPRRCWQAIHLKKQFGFIPEVIIVEKVSGQNNRLIVRAVLTKAEMEKEDKLRKKTANLIKSADNKALQSDLKPVKKS
jgi:hypothetical protein